MNAPSTAVSRHASHEQYNCSLALEAALALWQLLPSGCRVSLARAPLINGTTHATPSRALRWRTGGASGHWGRRWAGSNYTTPGRNGQSMGLPEATPTISSAPESAAYFTTGVHRGRVLELDPVCLNAKASPLLRRVESE